MRLITCGDALYSSRNFKNRLDPRVLAYLLEADAVFANAEFCTPEPETPPACGRGYMTSVRPSALSEFADLNIRLVAFANNHTGDYGWEGVVDTMKAAEARGIVHCGLGTSLRAARLPRFLDTAQGRVGIVAAGSTRSELFAASDGGANVVPRPGMNPLRWSRTYVLPEQEYQQLKKIDELLGTRASALEGARVETWEWISDERNDFPFGSLFEGYVQIEKGDKAMVRTSAQENDVRELCKSVRDASRRSDLTIFSLHTHEGVSENWYSPEVPEFVEKMAHDAIDAGADAVVGHGAHFMRGVEIYQGKPIFYNLGSLFMEFEAGESIIAPEMYESYGYDCDSRPSDLHGGRAKDAAGNFIGFHAERRFSENCMAVFDLVDGKLTWFLVPLDLGMDRERNLSRGLPELASPETGRHIAEYLTEVSAKYGTKLRYDEASGTIRAE